MGSWTLLPTGSKHFWTFKMTSVPKEESVIKLKKIKKPISSNKSHDAKTVLKDAAARIKRLQVSFFLSHCLIRVTCTTKRYSNKGETIQYFSLFHFVLITCTWNTINLMIWLCRRNQNLLILERMEKRKWRRAGKRSRENLNEELFIWDTFLMDFMKMNWRDSSSSLELSHVSKFPVVQK